MSVVLSATIMLEDLLVASMQVTVSVAIMQLEFSAINMWVTNFVEIMDVGGSDAILQVVFSAAHYAHDCFYCNYAGDSFYCSYVSDSSCSNFIFLSLTDTLFP